MKKVFAPFNITKIQKAAIFVACILFGILIYMKVTPVIKKRFNDD